MLNEAYILNTSCDIVSVVDAFESLIWTERYFECGDFELYMPLTSDILPYLVRGNYLITRDSQTVMVIEEIQIDTDAEKGTYATVTGRSVESILDRRVVWKEFNFNGSLQDGVERLLNENVISPTNSDRKIPNFIFSKSTDSRIASLKLETYLYGENLYEAICSMCTDNNIGFRVRLMNGQFVFQLYKGYDRTYDQEDRPYVVFSPDFDNILTSTYYENDKALKNCALVSNDVDAKTEVEQHSVMVPIYQEDGTAKVTWMAYSTVNYTPPWKRTTEVKTPNYRSGLNRREIFMDVSVSETDDDGNDLSENQKIASMQTAGSEELADANITVAFDASVDPSRQFTYGTDFSIGDVVQVKNEYGYESKARITEVIRCNSTSGESVNPTFTVIENLE